MRNEGVEIALSKICQKVEIEPVIESPLKEMVAINQKVISEIKSVEVRWVLISIALNKCGDKICFNDVSATLINII